MALTIRAVNLATGEAWDEGIGLTGWEASERLRVLRVARGSWRTNPVVHAIVDPATKKAPVKKLDTLTWLRKLSEAA